MNLDELLRETDALTYINSLKITIIQLKDEIKEQNELRDYLNESSERVSKLLRKADNQYRLITKLVTKESPFATDVSIEDDMKNYDNLKEMMGDVSG